MYLILSDELASCKRTNTLENFSKKLIGDIYVNVSNIPETIMPSEFISVNSNE